MKHLVIIGVGGFAREVYWHAQESIGFGTEWDLKGFLDGDVRLAEGEYKKLELPLLGNIRDYEIQDHDVFISAIGEPKTRKKLVNIMLERGANFINLISNKATVHGNAKLGIGDILSPGTNIHDHSIIGDFVVFNLNSGVGHDSCIGDFCSFMGLSGVCGNVQVGKEVYFATLATALPHTKIGDGAEIGPGSIVFKSVRAGRRVFGNPALPYEF